MVTAGVRPVRVPAEQRRRELAEAAAAQFHEVGYHGVTTAAVAASVGVTAPAVYRHFRNKNALLAAAIGTGLDQIEAALADAGTLAETLDRLAGAALQRRDVWVLLQREIRHLDDGARRASIARFRRLAERFTDRIRAARPDLDGGRVQVLSTAAYGVLASPSTRPLDLPRAAYRGALAHLAAAACATALPDGPPAPAVRDRRPGPAPDRGEQLLRTAITLFSRHGYAGVSVDDIGAAVGLTGPSLYHHFPTKAELLLAAYDRAAALLPVPDPGAVDPLRDLVERYTALALRERELFSVYVTEEVNLPATAAGPIRSAQDADVRRWITTLRDRRPELPPPPAELLVHAARSAVHDLTRVGRLHTRAAIRADVEAVALAVLTCPFS